MSRIRQLLDLSCFPLQFLCDVRTCYSTNSDGTPYKAPLVVVIWPRWRCAHVLMYWSWVGMIGISLGYFWHVDFHDFCWSLIFVALFAICSYLPLMVLSLVGVIAFVQTTVASGQPMGYYFRKKTFVTSVGLAVFLQSNWPNIMTYCPCQTQEKNGQLCRVETKTIPTSSRTRPTLLISFKGK